MKKTFAAVFAALISSGVIADNSRRETVGVDAHYQSSESGDQRVDAWSGEFSYTRFFLDKVEAGASYGFSGGDGGRRTQALQLLGRYWFDLVPKAGTASPFLQLSGGFEFDGGRQKTYENLFGVGIGVGMFVSQQSELRLTLKGERAGSDDRAKFDFGYYLHF